MKAPLSWYLVVFLYLLGLALGSLALCLIHFLSGGEWGELIKRRLILCVGWLLPLAVLFVPIALGVESLYPWTDHAFMHSSRILQRKLPFLNAPFWWLRSACWLFCWLLIAHRVIAAHRHQASPQLLAGAGLFLVILTGSLSALDWIMSLEPRWHSVLFGLIWLSGSVTSAMALAIFATVKRHHSVLQPRQLRDLSNLLLTSVLFWLYVSYCQYVIIWSQNTVDSLQWYLTRTSSGWAIASGATLVLQGGLPIVLLVVSKQRQLVLLLAAGFVLIGRLTEVIVFVQPVYRPLGFSRSSAFLLGSIVIASLLLYTWIAFLQNRRGRDGV